MVNYQVTDYVENNELICFGLSAHEVKEWLPEWTPKAQKELDILSSWFPRKAYNEMNYALYLICSMGFYTLIVFLAMVLEDISTIFDFVSAYAVSCIAFIIPAEFYRRGVRKFNIDSEDSSVSTRLTICYIFYGLGALNGVLGISSAILLLAGATESGE